MKQNTIILLINISNIYVVSEQVDYLPDYAEPYFIRDTVMEPSCAPSIILVHFQSFPLRLCRHL
jgi:hypothetical protein